MRDAYHEELQGLTDQLVEMTRLVGSAISRASTALLDADLALAESVIVADNVVDRLRDELDQKAMDLLARQQPVAGDLRIIVTTLKMSAELERWPLRSSATTTRWTACTGRCSPTCSTCPRPTAS